VSLLQRMLDKLRKDGILGLAKAVVRRLLTFSSSAPSQPFIEQPSLEKRFTDIYNENIWESEESRSGPGSELAYTEALRDWLVENIPALEIKVLLDAPCGDFNWMRDVVRLINVDYVGLDIVPSLIEENARRYATHSIKFEVANICEDVLPSCDLIMVRDCLFHLSFDDVDKFLRNLSRLDYKYLLTTTHILEQGFQNSDIESGGFRLIDLFTSPFDFEETKVADRIFEPPVFEPEMGEIRRELVLIRKEFVPLSINSQAK
jgi:SAM-dependent methyltransferase